MANLQFSGRFAGDIDRIKQHLREHEVTALVERMTAIMQGLAVLEHSPLIGRPTPGDLRELVIGRQSKGYVALYRYIEAFDVIFVLAISGQKEAGYSRS